VKNGSDVGRQQGRINVPFSSEMFGDDCDKALKTAQNCAVNHHRAGFRVVSVLAPELEIETLGKLEVELDGGALERAAEAVPDANIDLGAVESTVTRVDLPLAGVLFLQRLFELLNKISILERLDILGTYILGMIPSLDLSQEVVGTGG
jgi:hypothetical protein